ncbi:MMPL family transporter [Streptomyces europaeiscabiei]|uniref:MMPL family transporter n=1 Tax=Streptomyces europaeiscabiei TaxID=146819 RepID=A0ABU4N8X4_9ACTN|nr:MMPL family transporter [Streptomyces europaeiscabiei]MDX2765588.1 MMPL family transporter [Streptomyces europaeiscabiei]MDX3542837.1 MMPL family transporter [Streptomyces europaeiscabiei]MDX3550681.1 MMPL family transporter [Streptomyces europaeiscabiei]MDX3664906.1 MMPL family transporter [Streptomyces europaeiscabiei]MDX3698759.1 MMPL family transporter [Streptomyces europaeiscabiei]
MGNEDVRVRGIAARAGGWSARHRWAAVGIWVLFVVLTMGIGSAMGSVEVKDSDQLKGETSTAAHIIEEAGIEEPAGETVLIQAKDDDTLATDATFRAAVDDVMKAVEGTGKVTDVTSPYDTRTISKDGRSALVQFDVRGESDTAGERIEPVLKAVESVQKDHRTLRIEEIGGASMMKTFDDAFGDDFQKAEYSALPVALGILLIAFGAVVAALLPVALAMTAIMATMGLMAIVSHVMPMSDTANSVMLLVGLAVGVDYCLFYLRREREERAAGRDAQTALRVAAATSGRAIIVSGVTVCVAMAGMLFTGLAEFEAMGLASLMVVAVAMVGSVTVLPALLSLLGERVEKGRIPFLHPDKRRKNGHSQGTSESRFWTAVLRVVLARPALSLVVATGALLAVAAPAVGMKTQNLTLDQEFGDSLPIVQTYNRVNEAFPGGSEPAEVVVRAKDINAPEVRSALADFKEEAVASGASRGPVEIKVHDAQNVAFVYVPLVGGSDQDKAGASLDKLRDEVRPATLGKVDGVEAPVTGQVAGNQDFNDQLVGSVVPVFAFVVVFAFLLMLLSFRSLTIAVTSIVLNLLSVGAAYGILVGVFQHGWGASLVGAEGVGAIITWLPLFLFVILFGLSMDYHVFVVSRIREARLRGLTTKDAIQHGVVTTAGVVTSAAVIMVAVFSIFGTLSMQSMKQMGVGLAAAVLIDATIIRGVLLPAVMALLGERNWYLPKWLNRLPDLTHDESPEPGAGPGPGPGARKDERVRV